MNPTLKRYLISSAISFVGGFAAYALTGMDSLGLEDLQTGAVWGFVFLCFRSGLKAVFELIAAKTSETYAE